MRKKSNTDGIGKAMNILEKAGFQNVRMEFITIPGIPEEIPGEGLGFSLRCMGKIIFEIPDGMWKIIEPHTFPDKGVRE